MSYEVSDFNRDVILKSDVKPVLIEFWAHWCTPCRVLGPALESLARQAKGAWSLVKVNTEQSEKIADEYRIGTIPTVRVYFRGEVIAEFSGAPSEAEIRLWLEKNLPATETDPLSRAAQWIQSGNASDALKLLTELLEGDKDDNELAAITARSLVFSDPDGALALVDDISAGSPAGKSANFVRVFARLFQIPEEPGAFLPESPLRDRYLSGALALRRERFDESLTHLIAVLEEVPDYDDGNAKSACIAIFDHLGQCHPIVASRRNQYLEATEESGR